MENNIYKIFHHISFTLFWGLLLALFIISFMRQMQYEDGMIKECIDRGYPEAICRGI